MTKRFLVLIAAIGLLAACETAPKDAANAANNPVFTQENISIINHYYVNFDKVNKFL